MPGKPDRDPPRFHVPALDPDVTDTPLPADEARHLAKVLRLGPGARVRVFDGRGLEFEALVIAVRGDAVRVSLDRPVVAPDTAVPAFTLVQAVLKGASMDDVIRDATMMGAAAVRPLVTAHTDVRTDVIARAGTPSRWERVAVASAKQCRRAALPRILEPLPFDAWLALAPEGERVVFAEPDAGAGRPALPSLMEIAGRPVELVVGPEGGWSAPEVQAMAVAGCRLVSLGPLTLRAAAVPLAAMTLYVCVNDRSAPPPSLPPSP